MGVEEIVAVIEREAAAEANRIIEAAERQALELVADAEADVQAEVDAALERQGPDIRAASQRRINEVRLHILEEHARDDAARLTAVFDAAEAQVAAVAGGADLARWQSALAVLTTEALGSVGEDARVSVRDRDVAAIAAVARAWHASVVATTDDEPGVVVSSGDGHIEVDARISVRMSRARSLLAEAVAQLLHLETVDRGPGSAAPA